MENTKKVVEKFKRKLSAKVRRQEKLDMVKKCYNLKLGSDYNSDKDLRKNEGYDQLVKYKDTEIYLYL